MSLLQGHLEASNRLSLSSLPEPGQSGQLYDVTLLWPLHRVTWRLITAFSARLCRLYNILHAYVNYCGHTFSLLPTSCTWICHILARHSRDLRGTSTEETCVLFTLGNRSISCFFYFISAWLPFYIPPTQFMQHGKKGSSSQYPTNLTPEDYKTSRVWKDDQLRAVQETEIWPYYQIVYAQMS